MNILVLGGMGVIGSFVTRALIGRGHCPIVYNRTFRDALLRDIPHGKFEYVQGDGSDVAHLIETIKAHHVERIIHMVSLLDESQSNPPLALQVNVQSTVNALEAARVCGLDRVVYASSKRALGAISGEYGYPTYKPINEDYIERPTLMYDITKFTAERIGFNYELNYGMTFVALRFAQVYGPGKAAIGAVRSKLIENAMADKPVRIERGGDGKNDCIYVKDVAQGMVQACLQENFPHRLFHLGTGYASSLWDFANGVKTLYPNADIEIGAGVTDRADVSYSFDCVFDISRARQELGFEPQHDVERGVRDYVATMRALGIPPTYVL